jgi:hypothetical protein
MPQLRAASTLFEAERLLESAVHNLLVHSSRQSDCRMGPTGRCKLAPSHSHIRTHRHTRVPNPLALPAPP